MKYINKRQNPIDNLPPEEIENSLKAVNDYFSESWLCIKKGSHILQKLWNRRDALSTVELFTFGRAILQLQKIDHAWLNSQIKLVKAKDVNNQRGAIFEIIAISYLCTKQLATPAPMNQKGYDVDVNISGSEIYRISIKNYSQSSHERIFHQRMDTARKKYLSTSRTGGNFNFQLYISALKWPSENDWQLLYAALAKLSITFQGIRIVQQIENSWSIIINQLSPEPYENIDNRRLSYTFIGIAPYHQNEQQNFISKLDSAVYNLEKHVESALKIYPFVFIRLPPNASADTMYSWVLEYLKNVTDHRVCIFCGRHEPQHAMVYSTVRRAPLHGATNVSHPRPGDYPRRSRHHPQPRGRPLEQGPLRHIPSAL